MYFACHGGQVLSVTGTVHCTMVTRLDNLCQGY